jgi:hypothetical protein
MYKQVLAQLIGIKESAEHGGDGDMIRFIKNIASHLVSQKKYIAFFTVVPLVLGVSSLNIDCPIDGGTGFLQAMPGMENVQITDSEFDEKYVVREVCGAYTAYKYDIVLSLENTGPEKTEGWIKLILKDLKKGTIMDIQYMAVEIPANSAIESTYVMWFQTGLFEVGRTEVFPEVVTGQIECAISEGTGKVALNTWLLVNGLEDSFSEIARLQEEFRPPYYNQGPGEGGEATE